MPTTPITPTAPEIIGIHHVTAIAGDPQGILDFHVGVLGLRLIKQTVNFDDPGTWHLYVATHGAAPGSVLTFFAWPGAARGRRGFGEVQTTAFAIGADSIGWWSDRLKALSIPFQEPQRRFDEEFIALEDFDGTRLELVASDANSALAEDAATPLPPQHAIRGFHSATLALNGFQATATLLTEVMGFVATQSDQNRFRFERSGPPRTPGRIVELLCIPDAPQARLGPGSVHHIAFRTLDDAAQERWRRTLVRAGHNATPILDRQYFHSLYFREPGGVIVEFATDPPGFATDELSSALGTAIKLPPWLEPKRAQIEAALPPITTPRVLR
jgi:glyoxalase family protein